jgi:ABC-type proline/glycine betaine transport system ATPase subunit
METDAGRKAPGGLTGCFGKGPRGEAQVEALQVTRRGAERRTVPWAELEIAGVVVMAFRTVFQIPGSGGAVRVGEARALSAENDLCLRPEAWSTS